MMNQRTFMVVLDDVGPPVGVNATNTPKLHSLIDLAETHELWVTPNCSATRAALWTRKYPHKNGIGTIVRHNAATDAPIDMMQLPYPGTGQRACFGKYHMCGATRIDTHPKDSGWHYFAGHASNLGAGGQGGYWDWDYTLNGNTKRVTTYQPDVMREQVSNVLVTYQFDFVVYNTALIHKPLHSPMDFDEAETDEARRLQMLRRLDDDVFYLISLAVQAGYRVMMFSDNGAASDAGGGKGTLYDSGIKTPLYTWQFDVDSQSLDIVDVLTMVDGNLGDDSRPIGTRDVHYSEVFNPNGKANPEKWSWAVSKAGWKLIHTPEGDELYNLEADGGEQDNLAAEHPDHVERLARLAYDIQGREYKVQVEEQTDEV